MEELVFRSCMVPFLRSEKFTVMQIVLIAPMFFGLGDVEI